MAPSNFGLRKLAGKMSTPNLRHHNTAEDDRAAPPIPQISAEQREAWERVQTNQPRAPQRQNTAVNSTDDYLQLPDLPFQRGSRIINPQSTHSPAASQAAINRFANKPPNNHKSLQNIRARADSQARQAQQNQQNQQTQQTQFERPRFPNASRTTLNSPRVMHPPNIPSSPNTMPDAERRHEEAMAVMMRELRDENARRQRAEATVAQERVLRENLEFQIKQLIERDKEQYARIRTYEIHVPVVQAENDELLQWLVDISAKERQHAAERDKFLKAIAKRDQENKTFQETTQVLNHELVRLKRDTLKLQAFQADQILGRSNCTKKMQEEIQVAYRALHTNLLDSYIRIYNQLDTCHLSGEINPDDRIVHQEVQKMQGKPMPNLDDVLPLYKRLADTVARFEEDHLGSIRAGYKNSGTEMDFSIFELLNDTTKITKEERIRKMLESLPEIDDQNPAYRASLDVIERNCMTITKSSIGPDGQRKELLVESVLAFQEAIRLRRSMAESVKRGSFLLGEDTSKIIITDDGKVAVDEGLRAIDAALAGIKKACVENGMIVRDDGTYAEVYPFPKPETCFTNDLTAIPGFVPDPKDVPSGQADSTNGPRPAGNDSLAAHEKEPKTPAAPYKTLMVGGQQLRVYTEEDFPGPRSAPPNRPLPPNPEGSFAVPRRAGSTQALRSQLSPNASGASINASQSKVSQSPNTSRGMIKAPLKKPMASASARVEREMDFMEMISSLPLPGEAAVEEEAPATTKPKSSSTPKLGAIFKTLGGKTPRPTHTPLVAAVPETLASPIIQDQPFIEGLTPRLQQNIIDSPAIGLGILGLRDDSSFMGPPHSPNPQSGFSSLRSKFSVRSKASTKSQQSLSSAFNRPAAGTARDSHAGSIEEGDETRRQSTTSSNQSLLDSFGGVTDTFAGLRRNRN